MKYLIIVFLLVCINTYASPPTVMGLTFGTPKSKIIQQYKQKNIKLQDNEKQTLTYDSTLIENAFGLTTHFLYFDNNAKLGKIYYYISVPVSTSAIELTNKFAKLGEVLTEKYGNPTSFNTTIPSEYDTDESRLLGMQLEITNIYAFWKLYDTDILLEIQKGSMMQVFIGLTYDYKPIWFPYIDKLNAQSKNNL